jgi:hypothetical protein
MGKPICGGVVLSRGPWSERWSREPQPRNPTSQVNITDRVITAASRRSRSRAVDLADPADSEPTFEALDLNFISRRRWQRPFPLFATLVGVQLPFLPKRSLSFLLNPSTGTAFQGPNPLGRLCFITPHTSDAGHLR